jgi:hypothetical protein
MEAQLGYIDALRILGIGHSKTLETIDNLLGGAILAASAVTGQIGLIPLLDARDELILLGNRLIANLGQRTRGARGRNRTDLLVAAHAVIVINSYFQALNEADLPIKTANLGITAEEQLYLAGASRRSGEPGRLVDELFRVSLPLPEAHRPFEQVTKEIEIEYQSFSQELLKFVTGLAVWDSLGPREREKYTTTVLEKVPDEAVLRYQQNFRKLAADSVEFRLWMQLSDAASSRLAVRESYRKVETGLAGLQEILESLVTDKSSLEWAGHLAAAYSAQLDRPVAETAPGETLSGLVVPSLREGYINPHIKLAEFTAEARPAEDNWWEDAIKCYDIQQFLGGYLTSPRATEAPLVVLGQPGSGKSLLTKVIAARLPPDQFLPIRVELRHIAADAPVQDQIESALREATTDQMQWPDLVRHAGDTLPVVILDGFDELLQSTGTSHSGYLEQVRDFQRRETDQGRRVAFIVTSRAIVANRVRFPERTVIIKIEPFSDRQIKSWVNIWNSANSRYFQSTQIRPFSSEAAIGHRDLAAQPLLLLMLSFYDADGNALQQHSYELARAELYEGLLTKFVNREITKLHPDSDESERQNLVSTELDQLSIVAFAMFNRGRKSVSEDDLDADLASLLPGDNTEQKLGRVARRLSRAQLTVGRFFFIHQSQAILDGQKLNDYEFLHSTFGEYLVARLIAKILKQLIAVRSTMVAGFTMRPGSEIPDDRLWDLLSFASISDGSQIIGFIDELVQQFGPDKLAMLRQILGETFRSSLHARTPGYGGYEPRRLAVPARHAAYSVNLLLLNLLAANGPIRASALLGIQDSIIETWRSYALLWWAQLDSSGWDGLLNAVHLKSRFGQHAGDLAITHRRSEESNVIQAFDDVGWLASMPPAATDKYVLESEATAGKVAKEAAFICAPELDLMIHAIQPLLLHNPRAFSDIMCTQGTAHSALHETVRALIQSAGADERQEPARRLLRQLLSYDKNSESIPSKLSSRVLAGSSGTLNIRRFLGNTDPLVQLYSILSSMIGEGSNQEDSSLDDEGVDDEGVDDEGVDDEFSDDDDDDRHRPAIARINFMAGVDFPALRLYMSYNGNDGLFESLPGLNLRKVLAEVNPMELAASDVSFISSVISLAQERDATDWAAGNGLVILAVLPIDKLRALGAENVHFILQAARKRPGQKGVVELIINRYDPLYPKG